jgi:hypothetical protein
VQLACQPQQWLLLSPEACHMLLARASEAESAAAAHTRRDGCGPCVSQA